MTDLNNWTQKRISEWAIDTFGRPGSLEDLFEKTEEEFNELCDEVFTTGDYIDTGKVARELADVYIMIAQMAEFIGADLQHEVDEKMKINSEREWVNIGQGIGKHV